MYNFLLPLCGEIKITIDVKSSDAKMTTSTAAYHSAGETINSYA